MRLGEWYKAEVELDVQFLPRSTYTDLFGTPSDTAVVIDVLRMTTTASLLFSRGLDELFIIAEVAQARELAAQTGALLLGERGGERVTGFDGGNSPLEYTQSLRGQKAILCTSNGSKAVQTTSDIEHVFLGAIVNAKAVAQHALKVAKTRIVLICAGTGGQVSLDDVLGAACIAREMLKLNSELALTDACKVALVNLETSSDLLKGLQNARHSAILQDLGYEEDIEFAAQLNLLDTVPMRTSQQPTCFTLAP